MNILAPAYRKISNVVCSLQQQVCALRTKGLTLKTVINNLKTQSTSPSRSTLKCSSAPQVPTANNPHPFPTGRPKKVRTWRTQDCQSSSMLEPPPRLRQQHPILQQRPLSSDQRFPAEQETVTSKTARVIAQQQRQPSRQRLGLGLQHPLSTLTVCLETCIPERH